MPCLLKNRASNYQVVLNEKLDYNARASKPTSRRSARLRSPSRPPSSAPAIIRFNSGVLKAVHLNRPKLDLAFQPQEDEEYAPSSTESSPEKHRSKNQKYQYHSNNGNQYHGPKYNGKKYNGQQHKRRQYAHKLSAPETIVAPCHSNMSPDSSSSEYLSESSSSPKIQETRSNKPSICTSYNKVCGLTTPLYLC